MDRKTFIINQLEIYAFANRSFTVNTAIRFTGTVPSDILAKASAGYPVLGSFISLVSLETPERFSFLTTVLGGSGISAV